MADYSRFISYLYYYNEDGKKANAGHARIEVKSDSCKISIHIKQDEIQNTDLDVSYYVKGQRSSDPVNVIRLGTVRLAQGGSTSSFECTRHNINHSGISFDSVNGIILSSQEANYYITADWEENEISMEQVAGIYNKRTKKEIPQENTVAEIKAAELENKVENYEKDNINNISKGEEININEVETKLKAEWIGEEGIEIIPFEAIQAGMLNQNINVHEEKHQGTIFSKEPKEKKEEFVANEKEENKDRNAVNISQEENKNETEVNKSESKEGIETNERQNETEANKIKNESEDKIEVNKKRNESKVEINANENQEKEIIGVSDEGKNKTMISKQQIKSNNEIALNEECQKKINESFGITEEYIPQNCYGKRMPWQDTPEARSILDNGERMYPFQDGEIAECVRIEPKDIGKLPVEFWVLGNNSFLLHSYCNYKYLLFAKRINRIKCEYLLMVPGVYQQREKVMAKMFGFEHFKCVRCREQRLGEFGYWYMAINF